MGEGARSAMLGLLTPPGGLAPPTCPLQGEETLVTQRVSLRDDALRCRFEIEGSREQRTRVIGLRIAE